MNKRVLIKLPDSMKKELDRLRTRKGINVSAFIRNAITRALKRAA